MMVKYKVTSIGRAETREIQIPRITTRVWRTAPKNSDCRLSQSICVEWRSAELWSCKTHERFGWMGFGVFSSKWWKQAFLFNSLYLRLQRAQRILRWNLVGCNQILMPLNFINFCFQIKFQFLITRFSSGPSRSSTSSPSRIFESLVPLLVPLRTSDVQQPSLMRKHLRRFSFLKVRKKYLT